MGRTNPTTRERLDRLEREWQPFRRALRRRHRTDFDRLFERARTHADAASHQAPGAWRALVVAVLLAQERELRRLADDCGGEGPPGDETQPGEAVPSGHEAQPGDGDPSRGGPSR